MSKNAEALKPEIQKKYILDELKKQGFRITSQRKVIIDVIVNNECTCCKEIYYQAAQIDRKIGMATVYRMIRALEEIGVINRRNIYQISTDETVHA